MRMSSEGPDTLPPKPPLPLPKNFPFHFAGSGSHTSAMMSESDEGVSVTATRQKSIGATIVMGMSLSGIGEFSVTVTTEVIFPLVIGNLARSSQDALTCDANDKESSASAPAITGPCDVGEPTLFFRCTIFPLKNE